VLHLGGPRGMPRPAPAGVGARTAGDRRGRRSSLWRGATPAGRRGRL